MPIFPTALERGSSSSSRLGEDGGLYTCSSAPSSPLHRLLFASNSMPKQPSPRQGPREPRAECPTAPRDSSGEAPGTGEDPRWRGLAASKTLLYRLETVRRGGLPGGFGPVMPQTLLEQQPGRTGVSPGQEGGEVLFVSGNRVLCFRGDRLGVPWWKEPVSMLAVSRSSVMERHAKVCLENEHFNSYT